MACLEHLELDDIIKKYRENSLINDSVFCFECGQIAIWLEELKQWRSLLCGQYDIERLRHLAEADKFGLIHILKFSPNSIVFRALISPDGNRRVVEAVPLESLMDAFEAESWDNAFFTADEAWEYLKNFPAKEGRTHENQ